MQYFISVVQEIGAGISSSLLLFVLTLIFFYAARPAGMFWTYVQKSKPLSMVFNFVISVLRGTPLSCSWSLSFLARTMYLA